MYCHFFGLHFLFHFLQGCKESCSRLASLPANSLLCQVQKHRRSSPHLGFHGNPDLEQPCCLFRQRKPDACGFLIQPSVVAGISPLKDPGKGLVLHADSVIPDAQDLLFQPDFGPINQFLKFIGIDNPPRWVVSTDWAMVAISIVSIWKYMGYYMIVYLAALQGISGELYEAASLDGANSWQKLRYITIPMLSPTTFFVLIMLTFQCFKVFDLLYVMTGVGPGNSTKTLVNYIYEKAFTSWELGPASAGAIVLFAVVLVITLIQFRGEKKWSRDM